MRINDLSIYHMQQVTGTREAFAAMLEIRGIYKSLGVDRSTVSGWRTAMRNGTGISTDKMQEMLLKYGASIARQIVWKIPE